jgi:hypothetical protein
MFGTELPGNQGFQSFVQPIKSKSNENIRNRARQHRNQQNQPVVPPELIDSQRPIEATI